MPFNRFSIIEWKSVFEKLNDNSVSIFKTSWDEIVIQAYYRDENIPEEDWPSENEDLISDLFEFSNEHKPRYLFYSMYQGLLLSIGKLKYLLPNNTDWFSFEQDTWDEDILKNNFDDFFYDLCNYFFELKINKILTYSARNDKIICQLNNDVSEDFLKLCGYLFCNSHNYFIDGYTGFNLYNNLNNIIKVLYNIYKYKYKYNTNITFNSISNSLEPYTTIKYVDLLVGSELLIIKMIAKKITTRKLQKIIRNNYKYHALKVSLKKGKLPIDLYHQIYKYL
jgi:hypothetical protein